MHPSIEQVLNEFNRVEMTSDQAHRVGVVRNKVNELARTIAENCSGPTAVVALRGLMRAKDDALRAILFHAPPVPEGSVPEEASGSPLSG